MKNLKIQPITNVLFKTALNVRISDINYGHHLGHDSLVSLLHEARVRFLKFHGYTELNVEGFGIMVTTLLVNYTGEAFYGDQLEISIGFGEATETRLDFLYDVVETEKNKKVANALTTIVFYDYQNKKVGAVPKMILDIGLKYEK